MLPANRGRPLRLDRGRGQAGFISGLSGRPLPSGSQQRKHHGGSSSSSGNTGLLWCSGGDCVWHSVGTPNAGLTLQYILFVTWCTSYYSLSSIMPQVKRLPCGGGGGDRPWRLLCTHSEEEPSQTWSCDWQRYLQLLLEQFTQWVNVHTNWSSTWKSIRQGLHKRDHRIIYRQYLFLPH